MDSTVPESDDLPPVFTLVGRIERWLRDGIQRGEFKPGERLPSIAEIQAMFGAKSASTVREAQQRLVRDHLIEALQGLGVYVKQSSDARPPDPTEPVTRYGWPSLEDVDAERRTITIELRTSPQPHNWSRFFHDHLRARWPHMRMGGAPGGRGAYQITMAVAEIETAVTEFDCLIAESNAEFLTVTLPVTRARRTAVQRLLDERTARPDGGLDIDGIHARLDALYPDEPLAAKLIANATAAVTKAATLRAMVDSITTRVQS